MKHGVPLWAGALAAWVALIRGCLSMPTLRKHRLIGNAPTPPSRDLTSRLTNAGAGRCSLVSCIGACDWEQRKALHDAFNLDPKQSATLDGPLKPRCDLWELGQPQQCTLVLDADIPATADQPNGGANRRTLLRLCHRSSAVLLHLNRQDIRHGVNSFRLSRSARALLKDLAAQSRNKDAPSVYVFLPELASIKADPSAEDAAAYEQLKAHLADLVRQDPKFHFKPSRDAANVYRSTRNLEPHCNPKGTPPSINSHNHRYRNDHCNGPKLQRGRSHVPRPHSRGLLRGSPHGSEDVARYLDQEYKQLSLFTGDAYLRLVMLASEAAKSKLRDELAGNPKQDTEALVNSILADHAGQMAAMMASLSDKLAPPPWLGDTVDGVRDQLRGKLEAIVAVHTGLPKATVYAVGCTAPAPTPCQDQERAVERNHAKSRKKRGVNVMLSLSCMLRERGYGNRQGYVNYQWGPLILTLGYANDRDVAENKPGTGLLTPAFRLQPRLHVNVTL
ncbi:signal peptide-containing protein [Babesia caballi]|uniref:Signal peptide-containing protein n=1 Tax=Babesia caballi TaxID=5871 RepID=A0AAV4LR57_BABCB|nr:signal peptide-containing protein [Babesia caballi]